MLKGVKSTVLKIYIFTFKKVYIYISKWIQIKLHIYQKENMI